MLFKPTHGRPAAGSGQSLLRSPIVRSRFVYRVRLTHGEDLEFTVQDDMAIYCHYEAWLNGQEAVTSVHARNGLYLRDGGTDFLVDFNHVVMMQVHEAAD